MRFSAADIERYTYCPLSWWLSRHGVKGEGAALTAGHRAHAAMGARLRAWQAHVTEHRRAFAAAVQLGIIACTGLVVALGVTILDPLGTGGRALLVLGLFWIIASLAFLARAIRKGQEARALRASAGLVDGDVAYSDLDRPADVLESERFGVRGKPDYVVRREGALVPVELKTGRAPPVPHDSHVLQLAAYCLLVEETHGERPPYGVIQYADARHRVPFTEDLRDRVLATVLRMRLAVETGDVHRNHGHYARCRNCSRRAACGERLA